jgi:hypothetical protein
MRALHLDDGDLHMISVGAIPMTSRSGAAAPFLQLSERASVTFTNVVLTGSDDRAAEAGAAGQVFNSAAALDAAFPSQRSRDWSDEELFHGIMRLRGMECRATHAEAFWVSKTVLAM